MTPTLLLRYRIPVRFSDCDPLGHVNNAVYSTYLEQARIVLWRAQAGIELRRAAMGQGSEGFILARTEIDFRAPAHDGDELEVRLTLVRFGRTSVEYSYEVIDVATAGVVVNAKSVQVWYDYQAKKPVVLSQELKDRLAKHVIL